MLAWIIDRWHYKLAAVLLAFGTWLAVTNEAGIVQDLPVPIDFTLEEDGVLTGPYPTRVNVRLRGSPAFFRRLDRLRLKVEVDLRGEEFGTRTVQLGPESVLGVPPGIQVEMIEPDRLELTVERRIQRELPVRASISGDPPEGYTLYETRVEPPVARVEGPESVVAGMTRLGTDQVRIDGRRSPFRVEVAPVPDSLEVRVLEPRRVRVRIDIDRSPVDRAFEGVPVRIVGQAYAVRYEPETLDVTLIGPPGILDALESRGIVASVDVSDLPPRDRPYSVTPRYRFPELDERDASRLQPKPSQQNRVWVNVLGEPAEGKDGP